jgi:hypothetical protein
VFQLSGQRVRRIGSANGLCMDGIRLEEPEEHVCFSVGGEKEVSVLGAADELTDRLD